MTISANLHWDCRANGIPKPVYRCLKNGQAVMSNVRNLICSGFKTLLYYVHDFICQMNLFDVTSKYAHRLV